ncbi:unnamed protein product [Periconia digitata]|uniref:Uncharacterized protein n=1 Tax=Periconia digitata TaxID=1303443 RepID=A0A9W4UKG1_9PLEO|nr:unnamed protein product [Periconia digitata]
MSGVADNRSSWQRSQGRGNNRASGSNAPGKDGGRQQAMSALSGNAWKGKAAGSAERAQAQSHSTPPQAEHHPVKDFNTAEVKDFLKKKYLETVAGTSPPSYHDLTSTLADIASKDRPSVYHKVQGDSVAKRSSGAWGSRGNMPHLMPNGQDFFTQLKKQLATLDQGK